RRQACFARAGAEPRPRTRAEGRACRACGDRRGDRRRLHPRRHAGCGRKARTRGDSRPRRDRKELCLALSSGPQRLDLRNGPQAMGGDVVMRPAIEFIFDFGSPNAYLAYRALPPILERTGAKLDLVPCLLGGIFKATGNKAPFIAYAPIKG